MTIRRLNQADIGALVGEEAARYLLSKNQGGESNFKGGRYEAFFGGHQIAKLARAFLEEGEDHLVEWQSLGFLDDYMVRLDAAKRVAGYQLKNASAVSWTAGDHPLCRDFELQHAIYKEEGYEDVALGLVCSSEEQQAKLDAAVPESIAEYTTALFFPYAEKFQALIFEHRWLADDFAYLAKTRQPTVSDAEQVCQVVQGAWQARAPVARVSEVLEQARKVSPQILRAVGSDAEADQRVSDELRSILDAIPGFRYDVSRGFLHWTGAGGLMSGVLPFDCFSEQFAAWQQRVASLRPTSLEDLEGANLL